MTVQSGPVEWAQLLQTPNSQTSNYTFVLADALTGVIMNVASANTLTVPPNSSVAFQVGQVLQFGTIGAGQLTVVAGAGVTINLSATFVPYTQYSLGLLWQYAANTWLQI